MEGAVLRKSYWDSFEELPAAEAAAWALVLLSQGEAQRLH